MAVKKKKSTVVVVQPTLVPEVAPKRELILEGDPQQQLEFAHKAATALMSWVQQKPKKVMINGEQFLEFGDWQILARFYGATVGIDWTKAIEGGWEARAIVYRNGETIASAEAMCTRSERNWAKRDEFMLKSMAQTRASSKALRQAFGWVAELAGMKSTPAEEMGSAYDQSTVADDAPVYVSGTDTDGSYNSVAKQRQRLFAILKAKGVDIKSLKACEEYVATHTQLGLVQNNFSEIISILEGNN